MCLQGHEQNHYTPFARYALRPVMRNGEYLQIGGQTLSELTSLP